MKGLIIVLTLFVFSSTQVFSQENSEKKHSTDSTRWVLKTNLLYDLTSTLNIGGEYQISPKHTVDLAINYNPWRFSSNKKIKHFMVQPELRFWKDQAFKGHFWGIHTMYARYNVGGIKIPFISQQKIETTRYQGNLFGAGISYGYQWAFSRIRKPAETVCILTC
jgi:hypothetical protein